MIRKDTSNSKGLARLSPRALSLFLMLIPHFSAFGKMNGDPMFIKSEVVPLITWFTLPTIRKALQEIDRETNVKWFEAEGRRYLHSLKWDEHQDLRTDRRGRDLIPSYPGEVRDKSGSSPGEVPHEVEGEVEGEEEGEVEPEVLKPADASAGALKPPLARPPGNGQGKDTATASGKKGKEIPGNGGEAATFSSFVDGLPTSKRQVLEKAYELASRGGADVALRNLREAGFTGAEYIRAEVLVADWAAN